MASRPGHALNQPPFFLGVGFVCFATGAADFDSYREGPIAARARALPRLEAIGEDLRHQLAKIPITAEMARRTAIGSPQ